MKKPLAIMWCGAMCILALSQKAFADEEIKNPFSLNYQHSFSKGHERFRADWCYTDYDFHRFPGFFACINAHHGYEEGYIGPTLAHRFSSSGAKTRIVVLKAGMGYGFEAGKSEKLSDRFGGFARVRYESPAFFLGAPLDLYLLAETGGSGPRYRAELDAVGTLISPGILYESHDGVGPRVKITVPHYYANIWAAPLYDPGSKRMNYVAGSYMIFW